LTKQDKNISPIIAPSIYAILEQMKKMGLDEEDIVLMVQRRTKNRVNKTEIRTTMEALKKIEKSFINAQKRVENERRNQTTI